MVFVNFHLNQIQNCSVQIKKMKDEIFSLQLKKNIFLTFKDDARLKNVPPPLDLTRILKSYHKNKGMIEEKFQKNRSSQYHVR